MINFLILISLIVVLITLSQIIRIFEISNKIKNSRESDITYKDNDRQGKLLLTFGFLFIASFFLMNAKWTKSLLPISASEHGHEIDLLMNISLGLIIIVFLILQPVLFYFSYKYRGVKNRKALFITHNNKAEIIWTIIPGIVLTVLIIYGLQTWSKVMDRSNIDDALVIEVYGRQFDWTARYAGEDNFLGNANVRFISDANILGVISNDSYKSQIFNINKKIDKLKNQISGEKNYIKKNQLSKRYEKMISKKLRFSTLKEKTPKDLLKAADDDIVVREIHLPVNKKIHMKFRAQDVIHSAYMPHFRVQMNCVPGMNTDFVFRPTLTTEEMRKEVKNEDFDYVLLCNKVCGGAHYNMQIKIIVESEEKSNQWISGQTKFALSYLN
jgi:cytochrome c oxidase subunit 2